MTILGAIIIASLFLVSCGQNSSKQKELELREREVALKEKELVLKEKTISGSESLNQKITQDSNNIVQTSNDNKVNKEQTGDNSGEKFLGIWKYNKSKNEVVFIKISKEGNGRFNLQENNNYDNKIQWGNKVFSTNSEYLKISNRCLSGEYREWQGSASDSYCDTKIHLELKNGNLLLFKRYIKDGAGNTNNESFLARKTNENEINKSLNNKPKVLNEQSDAAM